MLTSTGPSDMTSNYLKTAIDLTIVKSITSPKIDCQPNNIKSIRFSSVILVKVQGSGQVSYPLKIHF